MKIGDIEIPAGTATTLRDLVDRSFRVAFKAVDLHTLVHQHLKAAFGGLTAGQVSAAVARRLLARWKDEGWVRPHYEVGRRTRRLGQSGWRVVR